MEPLPEHGADHRDGAGQFHGLGLLVGEFHQAESPLELPVGFDEFQQLQTLVDGRLSLENRLRR